MAAIPTVVVKKGKERMRVNVCDLPAWSEKGWTKDGPVKDPVGEGSTKVETGDKAK